MGESDRKIERHKLGLSGILLGLYLGTAPVYWFWNIPVSIITYGKYALAIVTVLLVWMTAVGKRATMLPSGLLGPIGFLLLIMSMMFGLYQSEVKEIVSRIIDLVHSFVFLWTIYIYVMNDGDIEKVFWIGSTLILGFCLLVLSAGVIGFPDWPSPFLGRPFTLADTGFGGMRTGWSIGIALLLPTALMLADYLGRNMVLLRAAYLGVVCLLLIGSQVVVGGRTGLVASFVGIACWMLYGRKAVWLLVIPIAGVVFMSLDMDWLLHHLRIDRLQSGVTMKTVDHFSASRIEGYETALKLIVREPILGHGFGSFHLSGWSYIRGDSIHNLWLRLGVQAGLLCPIVFAVIVGAVGRKVLMVRKMAVSLKMNSIGSMQHNLTTAFLGVYLAGLVATLAEPSVLLGTFQNSAPWWMIAGSAVAMSERLSGAGKRTEAPGAGGTLNP